MRDASNGSPQDASDRVRGRSGSRGPTTEPSRSGGVVGAPRVAQSANDARALVAFRSHGAGRTYNYVELRGRVTIEPDIGREVDTGLSWKYDGRDPDPDPPGALRLIVRMTVDGDPPSICLEAVVIPRRIATTAARPERAPR